MAVLNPGKLQVMTWNANIVSPKKHELFDLLLRGSIDIALINESYLKQGISFSYPDYKFEVIIDVRREIPSHFVFEYQNANWCQFRQNLYSRLDLDLSLDRVNTFN
jgi:hypothetical protein